MFDFLKSGSKKPTIDLTDYKFLSDDHTRIQNGQSTNASNKGAWRGIRIRTSDHNIFYVSMYNMNGDHPVWGGNIQMAEKQMKVSEETNEKIILRGFGSDEMGGSFADYGLTLHKSNQDINKISLHMHDRNIDIVYLKVTNKKLTETLNQYSDFDIFKNFIRKWNTTFSIDEKMQIAMQSDSLNNLGAGLYKEGNLEGAIAYFEQALSLMPNNDDALKNLRLCYSKTNNQSKVNEMQKKLDFMAV